MSGTLASFIVAVGQAIDWTSTAARAEVRDVHS